MNNLKQVIVMRKDLNMRKGKIAAQSGHAVMKTAFSAMNHVHFDFNDNINGSSSIINKLRVGIFNGLTKLAFKIIGCKLDVNLTTWYYLFNSDSNIGQWLSGIFTKICVSVNSEKELYDIYTAVENYNALQNQKKGDPDYLACEIIIDSGLTEFNGKKTMTCLAIGPGPSDIINMFTGDLPLL